MIGDGALCDFDHPFFDFFRRRGEGRFLLDEATDRPAFVVPLDGGSEARLAFPSLGRQFAFSAPDLAMLERVGEAVEFVDVVLLGRPLPPEVVGGGASWDAPHRHRAAAEARLRARLAAWALRPEAPPPSPAEVSRLVPRLEEPRLRTAMAEGELAVLDALGAAAYSPTEVEDRLARLAPPYAYLLCLRERVAEGVSAIRRGAEGAVGAFRRDGPAASVARGLLQAVERVDRRLAAALDEAETAGLGDVLGALKSEAESAARLGAHRNALFREVRRLEAASDPWRAHPARADRATRERVLASFRRLARRDMPGEAWRGFEEEARRSLSLPCPGEAPAPEGSRDGQEWS